ncbi:DUF1281 family ferredoxin-like fold protein [Comamonas suwonensis]|uniref:DUF1281 family ferredoxin-like fold protein n=1 Tax=Comamonas suwonensis TaxID=2606214 RepID=UPI00145CDF07|nr:hypothetical protein [Comamonas suwonensis]MBI1625205.1 hypothetical protein [Comamonas suwonensis]
MPNWVTNKVLASQAVIEAATNQQGRFDFSKAMPSPCIVGSDWNGISMSAETMAETVVGRALSDHPLLRALEAQSREAADIKQLDDESFEQFIGMLRNHRACGYLHDMDFARKEWGTKWNACEGVVDSQNGTAQFDTAWACPKPIFVALSKQFPQEVITITYADEDIGSNCGMFKLKNGEVIEADEAQPWREMSEEQKAKWTAFAYEVKGWKPEEE